MEFSLVNSGFRLAERNAITMSSWTQCLFMALLTCIHRFGATPSIFAYVCSTGELCTFDLIQSGLTETDRADFDRLY